MPLNGFSMFQYGGKFGLIMDSEKLLSKIIKIYIMVAEKIKEFHISLDKELFDKLERIKTYHGIHSNTEIIRFLITKEYRKINKKQ